MRVRFLRHVSGPRRRYCGCVDTVGSHRTSETCGFRFLFFLLCVLALKVYSLYFFRSKVMRCVSIFMWCLPLVENFLFSIIFVYILPSHNKGIFCLFSFIIHIFVCMFIHSCSILLSQPTHCVTLRDTSVVGVCFFRLLFGVLGNGNIRGRN